jgi:putative hydroxymethylpyrimidine transport system permease protein
VNALVRVSVTVSALIAGWEILIRLTGVAPYILPGPLRVFSAFAAYADIILENAGVTLAEILLGLSVGTLLGCLAAIVIGSSRVLGRWLMPLLVMSQAVPVFAIAPLLVLWLGYGIASKVAMASLIIFFPVTASFLDGLRRTEPGWLDLAATMTAGMPGRWYSQLRHVRIPSALPALASGLRVATATAPIGAVVGEWVGSSAGLGYLMLHANGRMQTDLMFAALLALAVIAVGLYFAMDAALRALLPWQPDKHPFRN